MAALFVGPETAFKQEDFPQHYPRRLVYVQDLHGDLAGKGFADQNRVVPAEVPFPTLFSRIEYGIELAAEKACQIGPLGPVAFGAGKAKDVRIVGSTMLLGDDMLNVERQEIGVVFVQPAVFTATASPHPDKGPESGVHHSPWELARSWRALDLRMATNVPKVT